MSKVKYTDTMSSNAVLMHLAPFQQDMPFQSNEKLHFSHV